MLAAGVRRLDVGGLTLTNQLKEVISYRQLDVTEETFVVTQLKEDVSYVAADFPQVQQTC